MKMDFKKLGGLLPAIVQDAQSKEFLMLGYMNREALDKTLETGKVTFWSRSRRRLWQKGESSGNFLELVSLDGDCDGDAILIKAAPAGPTCHMGKYSCFFSFVPTLFNLISGRRMTMPKNSYTTSLFSEGLDKICDKVLEESAEVVKAAKSETKQRLIEENCDLIYHLLVLLVEKGVGLEEIEKELVLRNL